MIWKNYNMFVKKVKSLIDERLSWKAIYRQQKNEENLLLSELLTRAYDDLLREAKHACQWGGFGDMPNAKYESLNESLDRYHNAPLNKALLAKESQVSK